MADRADRADRANKALTTHLFFGVDVFWWDLKLVVGPQVTVDVNVGACSYCERRKPGVGWGGVGLDR